MTGKMRMWLYRLRNNLKNCTRQRFVNNVNTARAAAPYVQEWFPDHMKYVKDTMDNRDIMWELLGNGWIYTNEECYIVVDTYNKTWRTSFYFEWLYRNPPPLTEIEDLKKML